MIQRAACMGAIGVSLTLLLAPIALAGGLTIGLPFYTLDLSATYEQVPVAMGAVTSVLTDVLTGLEIPPGDLAAILDTFDEAIESVGRSLAPLPDLVPLPLFGGGIEIGLPLLLIDGLRVSGGLLSDGLVRGIADRAGAPIPRPLFDILFDASEVGFDGAASVDLAFSSWMASTEVVKRLDLLLVGVTLSGGIDLVRGRVVPQIDIDVPTDYESAVDDALGALRLDELSWSAFGVHAGIGFELGLPFLRLYGDVRFLLPLSRGESWWGVEVGSFAGVLGFAILF